MEVSFPAQPLISGAFQNAKPELDSGRSAEANTEAVARVIESGPDKSGGGTDTKNALDRDTMRSVLEKTTDLVSTIAPERHLKYEVREEAGLMQVQVIDSKDGRVVRKIPADEIVNLIAHIQETLNKSLDVKA